MNKHLNFITLSASLCIAIAIIGCATLIRSQSFRAYSSSVPILHLPLTFTLDNPLAVPPVIVDSVNASLFKPKYADIVGRIFIDRPFSSIIYFVPTDVGTYFLETSSLEGDPIDTLGISGQWIVDMGVATSYQTMISTDGTITVVDTITTMSLNADSSDVVPGTDTTRVHMNRYELLDTGHFVTIADSVYLVR
jgi:hypothetical protein